ncbi:MAG TPA: S8 family serine peptidase [Caldilineaceae bacterium]|nr:S8 family serine peptidase [Caldilineaceae bacterium]
MFLPDRTKFYRYFAGALLLTAGFALANLFPVWAQQGDNPDGAPQGTANTVYLPFVAGSGEATNREVVPGQYIVVLRDEVARPGGEGIRAAALDRTRSAVNRAGGEILYTYEHALNGFAAQLPDALLAELSADPDVAFIEPDHYVSIRDSQTPAVWGLDRIDQIDRPLDNVYRHDRTGAGVHAYIIDTGIRTSHREFTGRVGAGFSAIQDGNGTNDCQGHGTHVAGTVGGTTYGVAKQVTLHPIRVLDCQGSGTDSQVIAGIDWVTANHNKPAVANMSLGGSASTALDNAVRASIAAGVNYAIAAGNDNADACSDSPARVNEALTVGAATSTDRRASFSNRGPCVDLFAPGEGITSAVNSSDTATATYSGTSMASPHVAGAIALYLEQNPTANPATVFTALLDNAGFNKLSNIGTGSPNLLLYTGFLNDAPTPAPTQTLTPTATASAPQPTVTGTQSSTPTATATRMATNTPLPTNTPTTTPIPTNTATPTATATNTPLPTPTPRPTGEPAACLDQLQNGDFERGPVAWEEYSRLGFDLICDQSGCGSSLDPASGDYLAWLGGANREQAEITQRLVIPAGARATLRYRYQIESEDLCGYDYGYVFVVDGGKTQAVQQFNLCSRNEVTTWQSASVDLSAFAGREITLGFLSTTDYLYRSSFFVDDVALLSGDSCPAGSPLQAAEIVASQQRDAAQRPQLDTVDPVEHAR